VNGVTILDTIEIYTLSLWQFVLGFTPLLIAAIICFVRLYIAYKKGTKEEQEQGVINPVYHKHFEILCDGIGGILSLALLLCMCKLCPADYLETRYKVKVDKTASFIEFHNKYTIIEEHTDYFIVKDRTY
jgi:hypothetical protein